MYSHAISNFTFLAAPSALSTFDFSSILVSQPAAVQAVRQHMLAVHSQASSVASTSAVLETSTSADSVPRKCEPATK